MHDFVGGDLNHNLNQWFKSNDLNQTTLCAPPATI